MPPAPATDVSVDIDGRCARVTIERPGAMNALSQSVVDGLEAAIDVATAAGCGLFVLRGRGGTLSTGADLKYLPELLDDEDPLRSYVASIGRVVDRLEDAPFVSICVVEGYAIAGGCELLLGCDLAVVAETARIGDGHLNYGLLPGAGGSVRLSRDLHPKVARRLLYTGETIDGGTAERFGLVSHAVPAALVDQTLATLVERLLSHSATSLAAIKQLHRAALATEPVEARRQELDTLIAHLTTDGAARQGLAAFSLRRSGNRSDSPTNGVLTTTVAAAPPSGRVPDTDGVEPPPVSGRWFEQLPVGVVVHHVNRRTVTETDNVIFTTMTMNPALLHLDATYAATTEFGRPLVNSMFTLALVVGLSVPELTQGTIIAQLGLSDVEFPAPVFPGDTVRVESEVMTTRPSRSRPDAGIVVFEHRGFNQAGTLVCRARRTGLMRRAPRKDIRS